MIKRKTVTVKAPELRSVTPRVERWPRRTAEDADPEGLRVVFKVLKELREKFPGWKTASINREAGTVTLTYPSIWEQEDERFKRRMKEVDLIMDLERLKKFFRG